MKGIIVENVGGPFIVVDSLDEPKPGKGQILVKSLVTAINPVEGFMQSTGMLVTAWPIVLGCDASGVVVAIGEHVEKFKIGDQVFGCTRLGAPGYSTFQEYFIMDEAITFLKPHNLSTEQAATVGAGLLTASLGLINGTNMELKPCPIRSEWVVILGGAGSVGQYAIQVAKLCGYKVITTCSLNSDQLVKNIGADASVNYKLPLQSQLQQIAHITTGKFSRVFDASAMASETGMEALDKYGDPTAKVKVFSTTNDWVPIEPKQGVLINLVALGAIGKSGDNHVAEVNDNIKALIPKLEEYLAEGQLKPMEYELVGSIGVEEVLVALDAFNARKTSDKKIVVRLAVN